MGLVIQRASKPHELQAVRELCREYADELRVDLETQNLSQELAQLPGSYGPPSGCLLLAIAQDQPAGCVALKRLADGICEMKRLYVRAPHRRSGLGRALVEHLIREARLLGYARMRLDTLPERMGSAVALYRKLGFVEIPAYWNNVLPGVEYMELSLQQPCPGPASRTRATIPRGDAMKRSTDRFLTTHTGSLPRPEDLIRTMYAKEAGVPVEREALSERVAAAVAEVVRKQAEAGIDVVNDGEMSKPSYATYIKDRLSGFGGAGNTFVYQDLAAFPNLAKRVFGDPGRSRRKTPACNAPIGVRDADAAQLDVDHLKAALAAVQAEDAFLTAASPGVVSLFFRNEYYPTEEAYIFAIAEAMRPEYETIANAGLNLQIDCPDLGMGRHIQYADLTLDQWRKKAQLHVEALNHAVANIPAERLRMHLCWGNYEGPHHCDVPLADVIDVVFRARPMAIALEAANPRHAHEWKLFETVKLPEGKLLIPGVIESKSNFIEHPELIAQRIGRYAGLVGRENVMAGSDCGFGTWVGQAAVDPDVVWAKMAAMAEGARIASREFWKR